LSVFRFHPFRIGRGDLVGNGGRARTD
jgi:hypothetical protein